MRVLPIIILMATFVFASGQACCSVSVIPSAEELQTLHAQADKGEAEAQFFLGMIYGNGRGVPQDYAMALTWYEKAATQGYAMAQYNLGALYFYGHGVPQNDVKAYMLWSLATIRFTDDLQKQAAEYRDKVATRMSPEQLAEAERLAQQCQAQQFKGC